MVQRFVPGLLGVLLFAGMAAAQKLTVPEGVLRVGQTIEISYSNRALALGEVVVTIDDGDGPEAKKIEVVIKLDARGAGSATLTVPDWWKLTFNVEGCKEVTRFVD